MLWSHPRHPSWKKETGRLCSAVLPHIPVMRARAGAPLPPPETHDVEAGP